MIQINLFDSKPLTNIQHSKTIDLFQDHTRLAISQKSNIRSKFTFQCGMPLVFSPSWELWLCGSQKPSHNATIKDIVPGVFSLSAHFRFAHSYWLSESRKHSQLDLTSDVFESTAQCTSVTAYSVNAAVDLGISYYRINGDFSFEKESLRENVVSPQTHVYSFISI